MSAVAAKRQQPSRFEIRRTLGSGGMGLVQLAWDRERRMEVALKTLHGTDPTNLARLKREFRSLASLAHPNLVGLYELFSEDGAAYFTMEAIAGVRFDAWCATLPRLDRTDLLVSTRIETRTRRVLERDARAAGPESDWYVPGRMSRPVADLDRLREASRGLIAAISALHAAGMVHCDLKPSNVLVEPTGRTVVLDFGLVRERPRAERAELDSIDGAPEYVAPEVVEGRAPGPAADWYAVGAMLYQAIVGEPPFHEAHYAATLIAKLDREAPRMSDRVDGVDAALDELVARLLERDPSRRAGAASILAWLDGEAHDDDTREIGEPPFVGRVAERALLADELSRVAAGKPRTVVVRAASGMGKSALIRCFAEELESGGRAIVLAGRCYQREEVPFKTLDGVVDAMAARLSRLPTTEISALVPPHIEALVRVFPVLGAVDLFAAAPADPELDTPGAVLAAAAEAARELLLRWSQTRPIVILIDDLQWSDADSAAFIERMIDPRSSSRILTLATVRSGERAPVLEAMRHRSAERLTEIDLGPLSSDEAEALARSMLGASGTEEASRFATRIAEGAAGVPFFLTELARHAIRSHHTDVRSVEHAIAQRVADLPDDARALLGLSALAGVPLAPTVLARAAGHDRDPLPAVRLLASRSLLRSGGGVTELVEPYHDRIREVVASAFGAEERRSLHAALGDSLAAEAHADPESVAHHLSRGGDDARALPFQLRAAERATRALAFDRAAALYLDALAMCSDMGERLRIDVELAEALVRAGRAAEAAPRFLACAERSTGDARERLERRAAEEWLKCGNVDEGVAVLRRVLAGVHLRYPESQLEAMARAIARILRIRRLDGSFTARRESELAPAVLARVDAARAAGVGLMMIDPLRGYGFLARFLLDAIAAGEPRRVAVGLCFNAVTLCRGGEAGYPRAKSWLDAARRIADELDDDYLRGLADACEAGASVTTGRWREGASLGLGAPIKLRATGTPATWERTAAVSLGRTSLFAMGRMSELRVMTERHLREANDVGDRFAATYAEVHGWVIAAMDDDVARGRDALEHALSRWSRLGFHAMHFWRLYGELMFDLYEDRPEQARARLEAARPALSKSRILAMQFYDAFLSATDASIELELAARSARPKPHLDRARAIEAHMAKMKRPYTEALAALVAGRVSQLVRDDGAAHRHLSRAIEGFEQCDMSLHAAAASARRASIVGGTDGAAAIATALETARREGIVRPDRWLVMLGGGVRA